jgi:hypothetical protein
MSEDEPIFKEYLKEKKSFSDFLKQPKTWLIFFCVLAGIVLVVLFYKSTVLDIMSKEEVSRSIEVLEHDTVWVVKESTPYDVKIVPSITFKIKNIGKRPLQYVSLEGRFEYEETGKLFNDGAAHACKEPLLPGEVSKKIFIKAFFGYSGRSKGHIINNKEWKKIRVKLFARTKGSGPACIGDSYPIKKEIKGFSGTIDEESFEKIGKTLQLAAVDSIWVDRIRSSKKSIIVPTITFRAKNVGDEPIRDVIFKGEFSFEDNKEKLSDGVTMALENELAPGETSEDITIKSELGYEATSKAAFVKNPQNWRRVEVEVFAKQKDLAYVLLGTYPIRQEIKGVKVIYRFQQK